MYYSCGCSCNCGDDPCGCQATPCYSCMTTSTTTTTTRNPNCEPCDELYNCDCIIYNGPDLICYGVHHGDNLCKLLEIAASNLPSCTTTTTVAVTTTTTCPCFSYNLTNTGAQGSTFSASYVPCKSSKETIEYLPYKSHKTICVTPHSIPTTVAGTGTILLDGCCITPPPPPPQIKRCSLPYDYPAIEKFGDGFPHTFTLNSMVLNGVEYVTSTTPVLHVNTPADLVIGIGLNNQTYPMNINDWLTIIAKGSGFVFYDNVTVIDSPSSDSTLNISITSNCDGSDLHYNIDFTIGVSHDNDGSIPFTSFQCNLI